MKPVLPVMNALFLLVLNSLLLDHWCARAHIDVGLPLRHHGVAAACTERCGERLVFRRDLLAELEPVAARRLDQKVAGHRRLRRFDPPPAPGSAVLLASRGLRLSETACCWFRRCPHRIASFRLIRGP